MSARPARRLSGGLTRPARRLSGGLAVLVASALMTGCAGVPESSAPRIEQDVPATGFTDVPDVRAYPAAPEAGESADQIVRNFLLASGSSERQHAVARQYLTSAAAVTWADGAGAVVLAQEPTVSVQRDGGEVVVRAEQEGRLDALGAYTPTAPTSLFTYPFTLLREKGEWRIANPPAGVVVSSATFEQSYQRFNLYFLDQTEARVVPDPRWFATTRESEANVLLGALMAGPAPQLTRAVRNELGGNITQPRNVVPETGSSCLVSVTWTTARRSRRWPRSCGRSANSASPGFRSTTTTRP